MVQQLYGLHVTKDQQAIWELKNSMNVFYNLMRQSKEKGTRLEFALAQAHIMSFLYTTCELDYTLSDSCRITQCNYGRCRLWP